MIYFNVYGKPEPAGSKIAGVSKAGRRFVRDDNPASSGWKDRVAKAAGETMDGRPPLDGPVGLEITFYLPRPKSHYGRRGLLPSAPPYPIGRPDLTKLLRGTEDGLKGIVWRDDAQVVSTRARKRYADGMGASAEITIRQAT